MAEISNFDSIIQQIEQYSKLGISISPYLSAIQSVNGITPGEKYKELNRIVNEIVQNKQQTTDDTIVDEVAQRVPAAILPLMKIRVGWALKSNQAVIEALKSEDIPVTNQAFKAKWFFKSSNEIVNVDYFLANVMPFVSKRTRFGVIKALSQGLQTGDEKKAEGFYKAFVELYGVEEALPLLPACSEKHIRAELMRPKLLLSYDILVDLFKKYPDLVIDSLRRFARYESYNKKAQYVIMKPHVFMKFLPHLIRRHVHVFVEIYNPKYYVKVGSTNTELFFKQAANVVVEKAKVFEKLFPLKIISRKLSLEQFELFFANLFPVCEEDFDLQNIVHHLEYYPRDKREQLLMSTYRTKYSSELSISPKGVKFNTQCRAVRDKVSVELFEKLVVKAFPSNIDKIDVDCYHYPINIFDKYSLDSTFKLLDRASQKKWGKSLFSDVFSLYIKKTHKMWLIKLMPPDMRASQVPKFLEKCEEESEEYCMWYLYMPPNVSLAWFKDVIAKSPSNESDRQMLINSMIESCAIDRDNDALLDFLEYYNRRHKNEKATVLKGVLCCIQGNYDLSKLRKSEWDLILEILHRAHTKSELTSNFEVHEVQQLFDAIVDRTLMRGDVENDVRSKASLEKIFEMTVDFNLTSKWKFKWMFVEKQYDLNKRTALSVWNDFKKRLVVQRYCFEKLLEILPSRPVWLKLKKTETKTKRKIEKEIDWKDCMTTSLIVQVHSFNQSLAALKKFHDPDCNIEKLSVTDYPWLVELIKESLSLNSVHKLRNEMSSFEPELLKQFSKDDDDDFNDFGRNLECTIKTGRGLIKLKKRQGYILEHYEDYLNKCRQRLETSNTTNGAPAARRFLLATKWHVDIPGRIIEKCLSNVKEEGSLKVLGIMLEAEIFGKIVKLLAPEDSSVDVHGANSKDYYTLVKGALPAMNLTSPAMSFDTIIPFFRGDYVTLASQALICTSERVSKSKIEIFAEQLIDKPISVKKQSIRLFFKIFSSNDLELFVKRLWRSETHPSIREMIVKLVQKLFVSKFNEANWKLMRMCIDAMTEKDEAALKVLTNICNIKNTYTSQYIEMLLKKIESFPDPDPKLPAKTAISKNSWIGELLKNASVYSDFSKLLTEELILEIVEKYCFVEPSAMTAGLLSGAEAFAKNVFDRPFSNKYYKFSFNTKSIIAM